MRLDYNQDKEMLKVFISRAVGLPGEFTQNTKNKV